MNALNLYKLDVKKEINSSSTYSDIESRVTCKKTKSSIFNWKLGLGFTLGAAATAALVIGITTNKGIIDIGGTSTATGALAYQMSPVMSKQIATAAPSQNMHRLAMAAPLMKKDKGENKDLSNILYDVDALLINENEYSIKDAESDKEDYKYAQIVSFKLLNGKESEYKLYYNEAAENKEEKNNKSSSELSFSGLAKLNEVEMNFKFESKEETKNNKSSFSSVTTIYENKDKTDYLVVSSESETKKNKEQDSYKYEHYTDSTLDDTYSISYDIKKNKTTVKVITATEEYTIEKKTKDNKEQFSIKCKSDNGNTNITYTKVIEDNGNVNYTEE